ncbi:MAG: phosphotransferase [Dermatophilaceae bacterium]
MSNSPVPDSHRPVDDATVSAVTAACPGLLVHEVLHRGSKALLLAATVHGRAVVAKLLTLDDNFWRAAFAREVRAYTAFATGPPPVAVPAMRAADVTRGVLVIDRVGGTTAAEGRYPATAVSSATVDDVLGSITALRAWQPPSELRGHVVDYRSRFQRYQAGGQFDAADVAALLALVERTNGRTEFAHGDLLPANVCRTAGDTAGARPVLIDWEFSGLYLPGFDLALQWVLLGRTPGLRERVEHLVHLDPAVAAGFWVNVACILTREVRIHREPPAIPERAERLADLDTLWAHTRARINDLARRPG